MIATLKKPFEYIRKAKKRLVLNYYRFKYDRAPKASISLADCKSVALLRWDDKLGDAIMSCVFIKALQEHRPDIKITVITRDFTAKWYEKATGCNVIRCGKRGTKTAKALGQYRGQFDAFVDVTTHFSYKELMAMHELGAQHNIGYNKKTNPIFNHQIDNSALHFKDRYAAAASFFVADKSDINLPLIPFSNAVLVNHHETNIAINLFGSSKYRQFSYAQAKLLLSRWLDEFPQDLLWLVPVPGKVDFLQNLMRELSSERVLLAGEVPSLELTLQLLSQVDLCFSPDTSVVHMASALNTPMLAIYSDDTVNLNEWKPLSDRSEVIINLHRNQQRNRVYVHEFDWQELKQKRIKLLQSP